MPHSPHGRGQSGGEVHCPPIGALSCQSRGGGTGRVVTGRVKSSGWSIRTGAAALRRGLGAGLGDDGAPKLPLLLEPWLVSRGRGEPEVATEGGGCGCPPRGTHAPRRLAFRVVASQPDPHGSRHLDSSKLPVEEEQGSRGAAGRRGAGAGAGGRWDARRALHTGKEGSDAGAGHRNVA